LEILQFPKGFKFGVSLSAFQFEMGASKEAIDPNSDWYVWTHDTVNIASNLVSGDLPEDGPGYWDLYKKDHEWGLWLGLDTWRLSIDWSRIFPRSTSEVKVETEIEGEHIKAIEISDKSLEELDKLANKRAVNHYREILSDLKSKEYYVILCLYHWPLPLWIHHPIIARNSHLQKGPLGWLEMKTVIEFSKYAAYIASKFNDLVDLWATMNEPLVISTAGYLGTRFPPGVVDFNAFLKATINLIQAHARAYDAIKAVIGSGAQVGVIYAAIPIEPLSQDPENLKIADHVNYIQNEWFFRAIVSGELDMTLKMDETEIIKRNDLKRKVDWIGINYYSRNVVSKLGHESWHFVAGYGFKCQPRSHSKAGNPTNDLGWEIYPEGLRSILKRFNQYRLPLFITENGVADALDNLRPYFIISHLYELFNAIKKDGVDVKGYLHWSIIDNYEWADGFSKKLGLLGVDLVSKRRYPRPSAYVFRDITINRGIPSYLLDYLESIRCELCKVTKRDA